jgi:hypothetical protein
MERIEIEARLRDWIAEVTADAKIDNNASFQVGVTVDYLTQIGLRPPEHDSLPNDGKRWTATLELWFPEQGPPDDPDAVRLAIARVLDAMSEAAEHDPTLTQRFRRARWKGTDGEPTEPGTGPDDFPLRVAAHLTLEPAPPRRSSPNAGS